MKSRAAILLGLLVAGLGLATSLLLAQGGQVAVRVWIAAALTWLAIVVGWQLLSAVEGEQKPLRPLISRAPAEPPHQRSTVLRTADRTVASSFENQRSFEHRLRPRLTALTDARGVELLDASRVPTIHDVERLLDSLQPPVTESERQAP